MNAAVGLTAGLGLDGDRCIRMIPRQAPQRGYNVPTNDAKTYFINSQAQLQGEVAR